MKFTYDTDTDSISSPDLTDEEVAKLQARLSAALGRNDPVRVVAEDLLETARGMRRTS
jgi:hypothetical protein